MAKKNYTPIFDLTSHEIELFWSKVDKTPGHGPNGDCWIWTACSTEHGYGRVTIRRITFISTRIAWMIQSGSDPGCIDVCHHCDNPPCVRESHLFLGSEMDNTRDCIAKGRNQKGDSHHMRNRSMDGYRFSKLTTESIPKVADMFLSGIPVLQIASHFNVSDIAIYEVLHGKTWPSVSRPVWEELAAHVGSDHYLAKLTESQVLEMRSIYDAGEMGYLTLGRRFGVGAMTTKRIVTRQSWKHLP